MSFELHERLAADTIEVDRWELCRVLLMNDETYPWLVLVPERPEIREIHELSDSDSILLLQEIRRASKGMASLVGADKMNVAALGNVVPQLHVHVIARFENDPAWPGPVWGVVPARSFEPSEGARRAGEIRRALSVLG